MIFFFDKDLWKLRYLMLKQNLIYSHMFNFKLVRKKSFGIDLGNNNTVVSDQDRILIDQPSCIVLDQSRDGVRAVGNEAYDMFEKTHHLLKPVKPLRGGVIADHTSATKMISAMIKKVYGAKSMLQGYEMIISGVPYYTSEVEKRAMRAALEQFNATTVKLIYEPLAAAIGIGLDIKEPDGKMVVDIGGGITEIAVISLSGIVSFQSIKVAGDTMDEEIQRYFRKMHNMAIGLRTAEQVKMQVGSVLEFLEDAPPPMLVKGKDMVRGIPVTCEISYAEVANVLDKSISAIELAILQTLEKCPPELAGDIYGNGIHITGGNAFLRGLRERLQSKTRLAVHIDQDALHSVGRGVTSVLRNPKRYNSVLLS